MLQTESIERVLKVISRYYLTHTPDIHLTIAEQKYKQIKGNEKMKKWNSKSKFKIMKKSNSKWIAGKLKDHGANFSDRVS